jgi:hypothetical protein
MEKEPLPVAVQEAIRSLASGDRSAQGASYQTLSDATAEKVGWADYAWEGLRPLLSHKDNRVRSIAGQALCNLARSASPGLVERDLDGLISVTRDARFVTARHVLLGIWKLGLQEHQLRRKLLKKLTERFRFADAEKNGALVRYDLLCALRRLFDATGDESVKAEAIALIPSEQSEKYRKKYAMAWRGA